MKKSFKLPKAFAEEWIKALRGGDYEQGTGYLMSQDYEPDEENDDYYDHPIEGTQVYCCLGVAAHIKGAGNEYLSEIELMSHDSLYYEECGVPEALIEERKGACDFTMVDVLTSLNDRFDTINLKNCKKAFPDLVFSRLPKQGETISYTFSEIANFLEENTEFV